MSFLLNEPGPHSFTGFRCCCRGFYQEGMQALSKHHPPKKIYFSKREGRGECLEPGHLAAPLDHFWKELVSHYALKLSEAEHLILGFPGLVLEQKGIMERCPWMILFHLHSYRCVTWGHLPLEICFLAQGSTGQLCKLGEGCSICASPS